MVVAEVSGAGLAQTGRLALESLGKSCPVREADRNLWVSRNVYLDEK